jgi:hypothetical protein
VVGAVVVVSGAVVVGAIVLGAVVAGGVVATAVVVVAAEAMVDGSTFAGFEGEHAVTSEIATIAAENVRLMTTSPPPASQ